MKYLTLQLTPKQYQLAAEHKHTKCVVTIDPFFSVCCAKHASTMLFFIRLNTFHFLRQSIGGVEERGNGQ